MEVAIIDWKNIDSRFVNDDLYEHINAPKWMDLSDPDQPVDDDAWFCRPSCNHPKTAEDFCKASNFGHQRSVSVSDIPLLGDKIKRDATLKKRGTNQPFPLPLNKDTKHYPATEDGENQDPNYLSTPVNHKAKAGKGAIKSSSEKKPVNDRSPKLRSTLSARNLFAGGGDILNKVAEFCNELKKLATRATDKESTDDGKSQADVNLDIVLNDKGKERKPLLETRKEKSGVLMGTSGGSKGQLRRKKKVDDDGENTPPISVIVKKNNKDQEDPGRLLNIRTHPPTPQCFSAAQGHSKGPTPKPFRPKPLNQERVAMLQEEVEEMNKEVNRGTPEKDARSMGVFWFLKPCTLSS